MTKRPTAFFTLQAVTALSSTAMFGIAGFLATDAEKSEQQKAQLEAQQEALVSEAVALQVAQVTEEQQAQVDAAMASVESLQLEYEAALEEARRFASVRSTRVATPAPAVASTTPPTPAPSSSPAPAPTPAPQPAPTPAPAPVDGNSGGS